MYYLYDTFNDAFWFKGSWQEDEVQLFKNLKSVNAELKRMDKEQQKQTEIRCLNPK